MASLLRSAPIVLLLALSEACGDDGDGQVPSGDGAADDAGTGQDDTPPATPGPPAITSVVLPSLPSGLVPIALVLQDAESDVTSVGLEVSLDRGASFRPVRSAGPTSGLSTSPAGVAVTITWDSLQDVGFRRPASAILRLTPADATGRGAPVTSETGVIDNLRAAASRADRYMATYGELDDTTLAVAQTYQLVIVHPGQADLTRARIADLQDGVDPADPVDDVIVLGYVSAGEDLRTRRVSDDEMRSDPRFRGDGSGPRVDPRGPHADGASLTGIDPRGAPSSAGTGFASFYLDDNSVDRSFANIGDGIPDRNGIFGACFVNAGDPAWLDTLDAMTRDGPDRQSGLREVLTTEWGRGLGCDGVFLDTIDTAAPNSFTNSGSPNQSEFEWTAPGFSTFVRRVRERYPRRLILQNRGIFFFDPRHPHYEHTTRGAVDFVLYESYRLNSNTHEEWSPYHYADNRYNFAPKLMAEANRADGFRVLSLGYAEGPFGAIDKQTLVGGSSVGLASLLEDIRVTQELAGFRHYLTDGAVKLVNSFVRDHSSLADTTPPVWTSTWNDRKGGPLPMEPTPRPGIRQLLPGPGSLTVRWDVALDMHPVRYALYSQTAPFDFDGDPLLRRATRVELAPGVGAGYVQGVGPDLYAHEDTLSGLEPGQTYHLVIRAFDGSPASNEEANRVVLTGTPL